MSKYKQVQIYKKEILNDSYFILWIKDEELSVCSEPGQFFELRSKGIGANRLFKPISVYDCDKSFIGFMIKKLGPGTSALSDLKQKDYLELIGPLGCGFPLVENYKICLVSGGVGYPPLWFLRKRLSSNNIIYWLHGGASASDIFPCDEIWTDDGSIGGHGFVTEGLQDHVTATKPDLIYACGPEGMLKQVYHISKAESIPLYVSMEAYMACGIGVCHGCVISCGSPENVIYRPVCKEGPVFFAEDICWDLL